MEYDLNQKCDIDKRDEETKSFLEKVTGSQNFTKYVTVIINMNINLKKSSVRNLK